MSNNSAAKNKGATSMSGLSFNVGEHKSETALNNDEYCGPINHEPNYYADNAYDINKNIVQMISPQTSVGQKSISQNQNKEKVLNEMNEYLMSAEEDTEGEPFGAGIAAATS